MKIATIIPAYNEEKTIADVVRIVSSCDLIDHVLVVSDGSCDRTSEVARKAGAEVLDLPENVGKGGAIEVGIEHLEKVDYFVFLDADLIGLSDGHLRQLLNPVLEGETDMTIGLFDRGQLATDFARKVAPHFSGQRAMRSEVLTELKDLDTAKYGLETVLTSHLEENGYDYKVIILPNLSHLLKEEKRGLMQGFFQRVKMFCQVLKKLFERHGGKF